MESLIERLLKLAKAVDGDTIYVDGYGIEHTTALRTAATRIEALEKQVEGYGVWVQDLRSENTRLCDVLRDALEQHYDGFREEQPTTVGIRHCTHGENTDLPDFKWVANARRLLSDTPSSSTAAPKEDKRG